ncbi:unnamed protein product, partial [Ectocarpus sp. 12 AP-2014]
TKTSAGVRSILSQMDELVTKAGRTSRDGGRSDEDEEEEEEKKRFADVDVAQKGWAAELDGIADSVATGNATLRTE